MNSTTTQPSAAPPGLVQAPSRRLALEAWDLVAQAGFVLRSGSEHGDATTLVADDRIIGQVRLTRDRLGRSGAVDEAAALPLVIRTMPEGASRRMLLVLGHGEEAEGYHASLLLPPEVFGGLMRDTEAGRAGHLALSATTNLWIAEAEQGAPTEASVTWLLGRGEDGKAEIARGLVERITWSATAPAAPAAEPEAMPAAATASDEAPEPAETTAEALARLNWSLKQIALVLVFLLIVVALK
jgi:hypothetical protein